jgi:tungstate transport system substrate-binding protein
MRPGFRSLGVWISLVAVGVCLALCLGRTTVGAQASTVRLALVNTPDDVLRGLLPEFERQSGYRTEVVYTGEDPHGVARNGQADLVISHYGHPGVEPFVLAGWGLWPRSVFANQIALLGPPGDPAQVRGLTDAVEAFRRIVQTRSPFVANDSSGAKYVEEILWTAAGGPDRGGWYSDPKLEARQAVEAAAKSGAYILWGLPPFLRLKQQRPLDLEPLVLGDPLFQRIMVSIVVNPERVPGVNAEGAKALQAYLVAPATQARIRAFRYPGVDQQAWWPAGRHNNTGGRE